MNNINYNKLPATSTTIIRIKFAPPPNSPYWLVNVLKKCTVVENKIVQAYY
jgi:hypothetical protein